MPRYKLTIEYAGTKYSGWQKQKNARTVQGELERAIGALETVVPIDDRDYPELQSLTWEMAQDMAGSGFIIGSHTQTHALLTEESREQVAAQTKGSLAALRHRLRRPVEHFAYPDGRCNPSVVSAVAEAGYRFPSRLPASGWLESIMVSLGIRGRTLVIAIPLLWLVLFFLVHRSFDAAFVSFFFRWLHVLSGILWIGLLWYFNFVQIPTMPKIPAELKPAIGKFIAPEALFWFRWSAVATVVTGLTLSFLNGYGHQALALQEGRDIIK